MSKNQSKIDLPVIILFLVAVICFIFFLLSLSGCEKDVDQHDNESELSNLEPWPYPDKPSDDIFKLGEGP